MGRYRTEWVLAWTYDCLIEAAWFTRGWTLQELITPEHLTSCSKSWRVIGTKSELCHEVAVCSGINEVVLAEPDKLANVSVSEKMSWAATRVTTRPEDEAYSLMGIFGVNMATLYGEGITKAGLRIQVPLRTVPKHKDLYLACLACKLKGQPIRLSSACGNSEAQVIFLSLPERL
jgi:hypothetical protein